jgi:glycosyltransferase involved in cell wall biosynthesis
VKITFLTPGYIWSPSGGIRVVYEYANRLSSRGHEVSVVHPRRLNHSAPATPLTGYRSLREGIIDLYSRVQTPRVRWQRIDPRVKLVFVPNADSQHIPAGDAIFATGWHTVEAVLEYPRTKGEKCYLIQGYETWMGPKHLVDDTWRAPLHKVVIAKWLLELGKDLGCKDLTYVPNAIDHDRYRLRRPIEDRLRQVSMLFSPGTIKGSAEGIEALTIVRQKYPDLKAVFFSTSRRLSSVPSWVDFYRDPPQDFIIDEIYNKSRIFLAPSWTEGSPLPPAEAACCGCALVATDIAGFREYIQNGVTGLLSPPKDAVALAKNLLLLLENDDLRQRLAKASNDLITRFNWEQSIDLLEGFLARVVEDKQSRPVSA